MFAGLRILPQRARGSRACAEIALKRIADDSDGQIGTKGRLRFGGKCRMLRLALVSAALLLASISILIPSVCEARPKRIKLPKLEVPDDLGKPPERLPPLDRSTLLRKPIDLTNADDRRIYAREQITWARLSGSLCTGCVGSGPSRKVSYVNPIAVLNARPAAIVAAATYSRTINPTHVARAKIAHRQKHKSKWYAYYSRFRYSVLKWRRRHHV